MFFDFIPILLTEQNTYPLPNSNVHCLSASITTPGVSARFAFERIDVGQSARVYLRHCVKLSTLK
jgi:hypothetical protein